MTKGYFTMNALFVFENNHALWGPDEKRFSEIGDYFNQELRSDPLFINKIERKLKYYFQEIDRFKRQLDKIDLGRLSAKKLFDLYQRQYELYAICWAWGLVGQFLDMGKDKYSDRVKRELGTALKKNGNLDVVFSRLTTPGSKTVYSLENEAILEALLKIHSRKPWKAELSRCQSIKDITQPKLKNIFLSLAGKYGGLQYYYMGPAAGPEYYFEQIKDKLKKKVNPKKELVKLEQEKLELISWQRRVETGLSSEQIAQIRNLRVLMYLKEARKEYHVFRLNYAMRRWYEEVAGRLMISPLQAKYILRDEYEKILKKGNKPISENELNERIKFCAYFLSKGRNYLYTGKKAKAMAKLFKVNLGAAKNLKKLAGSVAYPGRVKGRVKIVNAMQDLHKFNEGDILVSFSTNPSLVPGMNKAAAIVTDTGGVTCHAAIVSRELRKPCVIGTNFATRILKDGDLVEVDAERGVVRKIK